MVSLIVLLVLVGVGLFAVNAVVSMDPKIKTILNVVVVLAMVLIVVRSFGLFDGLEHVRLR